MKKKYISFVMSMIMLLCAGCNHGEEKKEYENVKTQLEDFIESEEEEKIQTPKKEEIVKKDIIISAVGDCTLGTDTNFGYDNSFTDVLDKNNRDFSYFFGGVADILSNDDLTIANLETTFTTSGNKVEKTFNFSGDPDYTNILKEGSVEAVNIANNHTFDYGQTGLDDTRNALDEAEIPYFGYDNYTVFDFDGIEVGLAGITGWSEETAIANTDKAIEYFHQQNIDLIIINYHWGIEREYVQNTGQEKIARHAIDAGAHLVLGHHPHVLQGIECYKGKYIVYSLGNFVFGGNKNPKDKDTMIFQQTFHYENGILKDNSIELIPCSLSSVTDRNDYRPVPLEGEEKERVLKKVLDNSRNVDYKY